MRPDAEAVWSTYRALLLDPQGGERWQALLADDALVVVGGKALPKRGLGEGELAAHHEAAVAAMGLEGGFPLDLPWAEPPLWQVEDGAQQGLLWLRFAPPQVALAPGAMPFPEHLDVALGLSWGDGPWRLHFSTLAGMVARGSAWAACRAAAFAEYPYLPGQSERCSRDWLDVAYRRRHKPGTPPLRFPPDARFGCHFTGTCCRRTWDITAPAEAQQVLDALPWDEVAPELAGLQLPVREDGLLLVKPRGSECQFLDGAGHCRLHKRFGTPIFAACTVFPFRFAKTPEGVDVVASSHCQSARDNVGPLMAERSVEIYQRLGMSPLLLPDHGFALAPELVVDWGRFDEAEQAVLEALRRDGLSSTQRLRLALDTVAAHVAAAKAEAAAPGPLAPREAQPLGPVEEITRLSYLPFFINAIAVKHESLATARDYLPATGASLSPQDDARAMRWAEHLIFGKVLSYKFDLQSAVALVAILHLFLLSLKESLAIAQLDEARWTLLGTITSHGTLGDRLAVAFGELAFLKETLPELAQHALAHLECGEAS